MCEIIQQKKLLRTEFKNKRTLLEKSIKSNWDKSIFINIIKTPQFDNSDIILTYVSTDIEVDTIKLINYSLENGKRIAVPKTFSNGIMQFYIMNSLDNLRLSAYGNILEPIHSDEMLIRETNKNMLCIVPALSFDKEGYRLGYGGGYYDRFISRNNGIIYMGICYENFLSEKIIRDEFDRNVKYIVTENNIMEVQDG